MGEGACDKGPRLSSMIHVYMSANLEDLLGRALLRFDTAPLSARIGGRRVLVTGAAGSIGSELCRQIAALGPAALIGFDNAETPLFYIEQELGRTNRAVEFHPEIGDITRTHHVENVFARHRPELFFMRRRTSMFR